jgi:polyisoprenoid-binding protein YceI
MKRTIVAMAVAVMTPVLGGCQNEAPPAPAPAKPTPPPVAAPAAASAQPDAGPPRDYEIDGAHSTAEFSVKHLGISNVKGRFTEISGKVHYDPTNPAKSTIEVKIGTKSIDTGVSQRDDHLRSPDFFDAEKNPTITFKSKTVTAAGTGSLDVVGDLTMHGVTHDATLHVTDISPEQKTPQGIEARGASAKAVINRKDWGLTWNKVIEAGGVAVGDEIKITIEAELDEPKPADKK